MPLILPRCLLALATFFATLAVLSIPALAAPHSADGWYAQGRSAMRAGHAREAAHAFAQATALNPTAANWRALADAYVASGDYAAATHAYGQAVKRYRDRGDTVTALALEYLASPYRQELEVYAFAPPPAQHAGCFWKPARFEPEHGLLLGTYVNETRQRAGGDIDLRPLGTGDFAVYFRYWTLKPAGQGEVFPTRFAAAVRRAGGALHLALEPGLPLGRIDDPMLLSFARAARQAGVPVFVRFASEFNDPGNFWSRDPALYRATFRRVAEVLRREAPNVAMVWMPMASRLDAADAYYPGPDAVDWVGLSLYSVPYPGGDTRAGQSASHPLDALRGFYDKYACRHPIQISEYAAAHRSGARPGADFTAFAVDRMRELYWGAALRFPRLKNINWLDLDMLSSPYVLHKAAARRNDYRLLNVPAKVAVLRGALSEAVFLKAWPGAGTAPAEVPTGFPSEVHAQQSLRGAVWVKTFAPAARVEVQLDHAEVDVEAQLPYRFVLPAARLTPGAHDLTVQVEDRAGHIILQTVRHFQVLP